MDALVITKLGRTAIRVADDGETSMDAVKGQRPFEPALPQRQITTCVRSLWGAICGKVEARWWKYRPYRRKAK